MNYEDHRVPIWDRAAPVRRWNHNKHCRKKFQKDFLRWYAANEERFAIKLEFLRRTDRFIELRFCQVIAALTVLVDNNEIRVVVDWAGEDWDIIREIETFPKRVPGGYVCDQCPPNTRATFPTRQALWRDEVFEAFLRWVNNDLTRASALSVSGTARHATWAKLVNEDAK